MAVVIDCDNKKVYLSPSKEQESIAKKIKPTWKPEIELSNDRRALWTPIYGLTTFGQLFTNRQLVMLNTFSDLIEKIKNTIEQDAIKARLSDDKLSLCENGSGARAYSEAIALYLSFIISRLSDFNSSVCGWIPIVQATRNTFARQGIPMSWDFAELNPFSKWLASFDAALKKIVNAQKISLPSDYKNIKPGVTLQDDAASSKNLKQFIVSTDPPYYDNIGYADLSDFFYVWLRKCLRISSRTIFNNNST